MSEVRLYVRADGRTKIGTIHGGVLDSLVEGLAAEPETIEELEEAASRFFKSGLIAVC